VSAHIEIQPRQRWTPALLTPLCLGAAVIWYLGLLPLIPPPHTGPGHFWLIYAPAIVVWCLGLVAAGWRHKTFGGICCLLSFAVLIIVGLVKFLTDAHPFASVESFEALTTTLVALGCFAAMNRLSE
jgi:hypothetical protein